MKIQKQALKLMKTVSIKDIGSANGTEFVKGTGILLMLLLITTGCSSSYQAPPNPQTRTVLPEVTRPQVQRPQVQKPQVRRTPVKAPKWRNTSVHRPTVQPTPVKTKPAVATVHRYSDKPKTDVITQREMQSVLTPPLPRQASKRVDVRLEASAYDAIPDNSDNAHNPKLTQNKTSSPAVKSLIIRARADMAIGRDQTAISKIERALRIESDNGELWYLLAKAHQASSNHQQAITMAKKAVNFAGANETLAIKSWKLIKLSGEASGDTLVVQEAINYNKVNP